MLGCANRLGAGCGERIACHDVRLYSSCRLSRRGPIAFFRSAADASDVDEAIEQIEPERRAKRHGKTGYAPTNDCTEPKRNRGARFVSEKVIPPKGRADPIPRAGETREKLLAGTIIPTHRDASYFQVGE